MSAGQFFSLKCTLIIITLLLAYVNFKLGLDYVKQFQEFTKAPHYRKNSELNLRKKDIPRKLIQRGNYWAELNKIPAEEQFSGNDSITLTTPTDFVNLHNLIILTDRWNGPVSCCVYTPGTDYGKTIKIIRYLRDCNVKIKKYVTFHFLYHKDHIPKDLKSTNWAKAHKNCSVTPDVGNTSKSYRKSKNLLFPINTARNIAREAATTHFVFPSDIELYPSVGLIENFFKMVGKEKSRIDSGHAKVFVLPVFELQGNVTKLPGNKTELKKLLRKNLAMPFHANICRECHNIPFLNNWIKNKKKVDIFSVTKRKNNKFWEPFFIGTQMEPGYDERLTWEGRSNKRIQAFLLCLLDYDFYILNNAFLVHRPGVKDLDNNTVSSIHVQETLHKLNTTIVPELISLYGEKDNCYV